MNNTGGNQLSQCQVQSSAKYSCNDGKVSGKNLQAPLTHKENEEVPSQMSSSKLKWALMAVGLLLLVTGVVVGSCIYMKHKSA